ncbi:hypothetical protein [Idiomarina aminovorans]|uniref:hypothetical protein n=1 Tax=Idiomarina aminovorans TaxID=2914829 RepID=UPI002005B186|nr:hypothetical protein [Idiomarina sp. ATCH4]MCK7459949.1 hypothetical protein [Idiomarina sp. ATCH4]
MTLNTYPLDKSYEDKLDWLELSCLKDEYFIYRISELEGIIENSEALDSQDIQSEDADKESEISVLLDLMGQRVRALDGAYPFTLSEDGHEISLVHEELHQLKVSQHVYLYCLLVSHAVRDDVLGSKMQLTNDDRDLMQVCSTIALAGYSGGNSYSFGFPRPDKTGFYDALVDVCERVKEWELKPHKNINAHVRENLWSVKDHGIDIISWTEDDVDDQPGIRSVIYGQVATGDKWQEKSVKEYREMLHKYFFDAPPAQYSDAIFIPFDIDYHRRSSGQDKFIYFTEKLGFIMHRMRIPRFFEKGLKLNSERPNLLIQRVNDIKKLSAFNNVKLEQLKMA